MSGANYNLQAIEQCRAAVSGQAGPIAASGDGLPRGADVSLFGALPSSPALAAAVRSLASTACDELDRAGALLGAVDRALDSIGQSVAGTDDDAATSLTSA